MTRSRYVFASAILATAMLALTPHAQATLTLQSGIVGGSGDVSNVIFNACGLSSSIGLTVQGCLNSDTAQLVNFTGIESLSISGGGQAVVDAIDGIFSAVRISLADPTMGFAKMQFNIDAVADGTATIRAVDQFGTVFDFGAVALSGSGQNRFTLGSLDGQVAVSLSIQSTVGLQNITDLQQVRIGSMTSIVAEEAPVAEPASLALLGAGMIALGAIRRRRTAAVPAG